MRLTLILLITITIAILPKLVFAGDYIGEKECYTCHSHIKRKFMANIHGRIFSGNPGNNLEAKSCEACHGPGKAHKIAADKIDKGEKVPLDVEFSLRKGAGSVAKNNGLCLKCHEKNSQSIWKGSSHEMSEIGCIDCHTIHGEEKAHGTRSCISCHVQKRTQMQRSSHVPLREGKVTCTSCHNPHGSMGPNMLRQSSTNENCYSCHAEKRGPLIWEHAPVRENCSNCHDPHGSNLGSLLVMRVPYLCESCHAMIYHPSTVYDGATLAARDKHQVGKACLNCHPMIHGSNHPSGARNSR